MNTLEDRLKAKPVRHLEPTSESYAVHLDSYVLSPQLMEQLLAALEAAQTLAERTRSVIAHSHDHTEHGRSGIEFAWRQVPSGIFAELDPEPLERALAAIQDPTLATPEPEVSAP